LVSYLHHQNKQDTNAKLFKTYMSRHNLAARTEADGSLM